MEWSEHQKAIFNFVENEAGNAVVAASPGSGKSTTLVGILNHIPKFSHPNTLFLAFNNKIVNELEKKVPPGVLCKTFHSFCVGQYRKFNSKMKIDSKKEKLTKIIISLVGAEDDEEENREALAKAISLSKANMAETEEDVQRVVDRHEIEHTRKDFNKLVLAAMDLSAKQKDIVDFDDMIWFIHKFNIKLPTYDFAMVDEAQDCSPIRIEICRRLVDNSKTRLFAVLDRHQVIFTFAGSCMDSDQQLIQMLNAKVFSLPVSYRCAKKIVAEAQKYVPEIEPFEQSPDGIVEDATEEKMMDNVRIGDFILSRIKAPLVRICLGLIKRGVRCNINGRDMGKTLGFMIKTSKAKTVDEFLEWLDKWKIDQMESYTKRKLDTEVISDRVDVLHALCDGTNDLKEVIKRTKELFVDTDKQNPGMDKVILSAIHSVKGLERDRVWLLSDTCRPDKGVEEKNVYYVALTRAKRELYFVKGIAR